MRIIFIAILLTLSACSADNYDDCILENMDNAKNVAASNLIRASCRAKFPEMTKIIHKDGSVSEITLNEFESMAQDFISIEDDARNELGNVHVESNGEGTYNVSNVGKFRIKEIRIGALSDEAETCPRYIKDYFEFSSCRPYGLDNYIETGETETVTCNHALTGNRFCTVMIKFN
jgi:hypothetical protein